ncbi:MAG: hypothetical protein IPK66_14255 [Rhodospirillales bacterium]|nr:hypothetical protein [Rhodospirillales bacterium]
MSPVAALRSVASPVSELSRDTTNSSTAASLDAVSAASTEASVTTAVPAVTAGARTDDERQDTPEIYSASTSFDAATGEWAFVIERHPPETGVTVASQKGFVSHYLAMATSSADLRNAFSMRI